ncbi:polyphosphate kinase 2 family protein [Antrihabitans stalactiti]|uniref:Polyphosphate kinase 2 family protein n=1 Tax=Antrihabitans stalactiti TaxID=2584121 RepID=A0A848KNY9_9NOCA|nr:polyphosphate kinase 2 family protein [Antrihabitans stalactiti]NMN98010.1 polyphosphate kinase 2 family protein [Antrihabitans stalactiti]
MAKTKSAWSKPASEALRATKKTSLAEFNTRATPGFSGDSNQAAELLTERGAVFAALQEKLYANGRSGGNRSVLLVLQGMDTSGKGGIVRHVIRAADPSGIDHTSFGVPTEEEKRHHYLWRINRALPAAGQIGVFDRSHYEDVLVVRVHNLVPPEVWGARYDEINGFERDLVDGGTTVIKVALVISHDEQRDRLAERLDRPDKYWKFNPGDIDERKLWPAYQEAYQAVFDRTSTDYAPWYLVPADHKWFSRLAVTELLIGALEAMELDWPPADFDVEAEKKRLAQS